jgi:hypothetical protein
VQEWKVSREESKDLVKRGVVISDGEEDAEVIAVELNENPSCNRVDGETEVSVTHIPNFESLPEKLIAVSKRSFLSVGSLLFECISFSKVNGFDNVAVSYIFPRCSLLNFEFKLQVSLYLLGDFNLQLILGYCQLFIFEV